MDALTAIRASKLFKASNHQSRILAAMMDPTNKDLVKQLDSYVDDDSLNTRSEANEAHTESESERDTSKNNVSSAPEKKYSSSPKTTPAFAESEKKSNEKEVEQPEPKSSSNEVSVDEEVEESKTIVSSKEFISNLDNVSSSLDAIKGLLNANESTAGVLRLQIKENELWCYYQDSVNMNDIMNDVINLLIASGYPYLDFNRLARSDNAIVFEITQSSTVEPISISDEEES